MGQGIALQEELIRPRMYAGCGEGGREEGDGAVCDTKALLCPCPCTYCTLVLLTVTQKQPSVKGKARKESSPGVNDAQVNYVMYHSGYVWVCVMHVAAYLYLAPCVRVQRSV